MPGDIFSPNKPATTIPDAKKDNGNGPDNGGNATIELHSNSIGALKNERPYTDEEVKTRWKKSFNSKLPIENRKPFFTRHNVGTPQDGYPVKCLVWHEGAHALLIQQPEEERKAILEEAATLLDTYRKQADDNFREYRDKEPRPATVKLPLGFRKKHPFDITCLSAYADTSVNEFLSEAFVARKLGAPPLPQELCTLLDRLNNPPEKG